MESEVDLGGLGLEEGGRLCSLTGRTRVPWAFACWFLRGRHVNTLEMLGPDHGPSLVSWRLRLQNRH